MKLIEKEVKDMLSKLVDGQYANAINDAARLSAEDAVDMVAKNGDLKAELARVQDAGEVFSGDGDWDIGALASISPRFQDMDDDYLLDVIAPAVKAAELRYFVAAAEEAIADAEEEARKIYVACRESGDIIEEALDYEDAKATIERFEKEDKDNGDYSPNFYDIVDAAHRHIEEPAHA